ncbi:hypothetical protein GGR56DRAFT_643359 [Xylariaceae sp. FL0804]|nr:hypothetical protein GGR56DRAFT_643359 [Xylariaceae sp. FL0804]
MFGTRSPGIRLHKLALSARVTGFVTAVRPAGPTTMLARSIVSAPAATSSLGHRVAAAARHNLRTDPALPRRLRRSISSSRRRASPPAEPASASWSSLPSSSNYLLSTNRALSRGDATGVRDREGLHALTRLPTDGDGFPRPQSPEAESLLAAGVEGLGAYRNYLAELSIPDAREAIRADDAGGRVIQWVRAPVIWGQIEACKDFPSAYRNWPLFQLVADILVGAGENAIIEKWSGADEGWERGKFPKPKPPEQLRWQGEFVTAYLQALIWWDPDKSADRAIVFFISMVRKRGRGEGYSYTFVPSVDMMIGTILRQAREYRVKPCVFDRGLEAMLLSQGSYYRHADRAIYPLFHPSCPTADLFLSWLQSVQDDPLSFHRIKAWGIRPHNVYRWMFSLRALASELLRSQKREGDAQWLEHTIAELWGRGSRFSIEYGLEDYIRKRMTGGAEAQRPRQRHQGRFSRGA